MEDCQSKFGTEWFSHWEVRYLTGEGINFSFQLINLIRSKGFQFFKGSQIFSKEINSLFWHLKRSHYMKVLGNRKVENKKRKVWGYCLLSLVETRRFKDLINVYSVIFTVKRPDQISLIKPLSKLLKTMDHENLGQCPFYVVKEWKQKYLFFVSSFSTKRFNNTKKKKKVIVSFLFFVDKRKFRNTERYR